MSRQRHGVRPVLWRCLDGLWRRTGEKRQRTAALQNAIARIGAWDVAPASWSASSPLALFGRAVVSDGKKAAGDCTHSKTLARGLGLGKSRQRRGVRPVPWRCFDGLWRRAGRKRQRTAALQNAIARLGARERIPRGARTSRTAVKRSFVSTHRPSSQSRHRFAESNPPAPNRVVPPGC
jgi:uncharacterized small protein (DUF1192 family)